MPVARWLPISLTLLAVAAILGCTEEPRAPPLINEAMYQNADLGFRCLAPNGWTMTSRSNLPPGPLASPVRVVNYIRTVGDRPAEFAIVAGNASEEPERVIEQFPLGPDRWTKSSAIESVSVGGEPAKRFHFTRRDGSDLLSREVTAITHGPRLILFYITSADRDRDNRDAARASLESLEWTR